MPITLKNAGTKYVVGIVLGCVFHAVMTSATQAQTYYYTVAAPTAGTPAVTTAPVYYYPTTGRFQRTWNGYSPQYYQIGYNTPTYQATYPTQYNQVVYSQPVAQTNQSTEATQAATPGVPVIQVSQVTEQPAQTATTAQPATDATAATAPAGDVYGFTNWLNQTRAAYGLPAVGYDPNLESWAAQNSMQQASSGIGHFVMGPARRQNSAMGGFPGIESMWMNSPAHRAALLDPTIRWVGIAAYGAYWTFNAY